MNIEEYFKSLTLELTGLKNRVRNFIADAHWQTDGEWKESVLRSFLNRNISQSVQVGRGFVVTPSGPTSQIDVLIYSSDCPVLFRDGDLVFIPPEGVRGIIEVKTNITSLSLRPAFEKLHLIDRQLTPYDMKAIIGLFSYDTDLISNQPVLNLLRELCTDTRKVIDIVCMGQSRFIKYWQNKPDGRKTLYEKWHSYVLDNMAYGYFIHNILLDISPRLIREELWFPENSKEISKDGEIYRLNAFNERLSIGDKS